MPQMSYIYMNISNTKSLGILDNVRQGKNLFRNTALIDMILIIFIYNNYKHSSSCNNRFITFDSIQFQHILDTHT